MFGGGREDVEDAAAHRELSAAAHHVDPGVGEFDQACGKVVEAQLGSHPQCHRLDLGQVGGHRLQQRAHRRHHHRQRGPQVRIVRVDQPAQQHHPRADGVHTGRQPFMRKRLPGREQCGRVPVHPAQFRGQVVSLAACCSHHQQRATARKRAGHEDLGTGRAHQRQLQGALRCQLGQLEELRRLQYGVNQSRQRALDRLVPRSGHGGLILGKSKIPCGGQ